MKPIPTWHERYTNCSLETAMQAEIDELRQRCAELESENAALKAELAALRDQKPVGFVHYVGGAIDGEVIREVRYSNEVPLYRAAGAKP